MDPLPVIASLVTPGWHNAPATVARVGLQGGSKSAPCAKQRVALAPPHGQGRLKGPSRVRGVHLTWHDWPIRRLVRQAIVLLPRWLVSLKVGPPNQNARHGIPHPYTRGTATR